MKEKTSYTREEVLAKTHGTVPRPECSKTRFKNLQICKSACLSRFLYVGYLVGNEALQVLELVRILFKAFWNLFCSDSSFKPIIYCQFTALEF